MRAAAAAALFLITWTCATARGSREPPAPPEHPEWILGKSYSPPTASLLEVDDRGYDCLDLFLELHLDFNTRTILGRARHRIRATREIASLTLDLTDSLRVDAVWRGIGPAGFTHQNRMLEVTIDPPLAAGEQAELTIFYDGRPPRDGLLGFSFQDRNGVPAAYTLSEPTSASAWWPCKDVPDDKLTATIVLDVPDTLYAGSNGLLISDQTHAGRRTMTWREGFPIAPYLVSVACTNYAPFGDIYTGQEGEPLPLLYLPYPEHRTLAEASWGRTPAMLAAFEARFGPYPFEGEKYGMAEFSWGGAMENQTLTSYGDYLVDGTDTNDWVVAHEMSHQWWGNRVTLASWEHMWLNEGFARYSEALWFESTGGIEAYREWIRGMWRDDFQGPIVPPDYIFNATVYLKGAWILHMLRGILGEVVFFDGLRFYGDSHAYANATTEDLIAAFEETSGRSLRWFFDRWIYGVGQPGYFASWTVRPGEEGALLDLTIEQTQGEETFRMPIEIEIEDDLGAYRRIVDDSLRVQTFTLPVRIPPLAVNLDPDDWILKRSINGSAAPEPPVATSPLALPWPQPGPPPYRIDVAPAGAPGEVEVIDAAGRRLAMIRSAFGSAIFDGRDSMGRDLPSGLYFLRPTVTGGGPVRRLWIVR